MIWCIQATCQNYYIPVRLLNTSADSIVLRKGTTVANASTLEQSTLVASTAEIRTEDEPQLEVTSKQ